MAASTEGTSSIRTNYYNISYGMLSTRVKEAPEGYSEITESELKSKTQAVENIDLRKKYIVKTGDYPITAFYSTVEGDIKSVEKDEYEKGISLKVNILDKEGDESVLQTKFYGKVGADFMNRLLSLKGRENIKFSPYSIPNESEIEGKNVKYYNSGVSLRENGEKVNRAYDRESSMPESERVQNAEGQMVTSRVKQVNFLWEKVNAKFNSSTPVPKQQTTKKEPIAVEQEDHNDLPF